MIIPHEVTFWSDRAGVADLGPISSPQIETPKNRPACNQSVERSPNKVEALLASARHCHAGITS